MPISPSMRVLAPLALTGILLGCGADSSGPGSDKGTVEHPRKLLGIKDTVLSSSGSALASRAGAVGASLAPPVIGLPYGAAVNADGVTYVTLHGDLDAIVRWDFSTRTFKDGVTLTGDEPTNVSFSPDGKRAYVAAQYSDRVDVVDVATDSIIAEAPTPGNDPYQTVVNPDGSRFYASGNGDRIWVFDAATNDSITTIPVDADPNGMAITPDGKWMFITHLSSTVIGRITLATGVYDTLTTVGGTPVHGLSISPDGTKLYLVSQGTDSLYEFNTTTGENLAQVPAGDRPFGLAATPDGGEVWITSLGGELRRFNTDGLVPITTLFLGGYLRRLAIDPAGNSAVVADEDGYIIVIR